MMHPSDFPPGWNGLATTPPLGWRSWNSYGNRVSADNFNATMQAMAAKVWTVDGKSNVSLIDIGYATAGIDEGWEGCGQGVNGTQHDAAGNPVINDKFPDMASLVKQGHDLGLKVGWYENGCACGERHELELNYEGDVRKLHEFGFDGVKLDGCGAQRNMTKYAALMKATGQSYLIENCHWGRCTEGDDSSCPTTDWCPFNWYRTSGDINSSPMSWYGNLQTTIPFQDKAAPLSRPGCWAYPDMLEVGRIEVGGAMHYGWNRAHFGAWCVVSAPLILGMDLTDTAAVGAVVDVVSNEEAIAINQEWAGHPGGLVASSLAAAVGFPVAVECNASDPTQQGWRLQPGESGRVALQAPGGGCLGIHGAGAPGGAGGLLLAACNGSDTSQGFAYDSASRQLAQFPKGSCVDVHNDGPLVWMYGCSSGANDLLSLDGATAQFEQKGLCLGVVDTDPAGGTFAVSTQAWAKPLAASVALLLVNPDTKPHTISVPLSALPLTGGGANLTTTGAPLAVRDVWAKADKPPLAKGATAISMTVPGLDSAFVRLTPAKEVAIVEAA